MSNSKVFRCEVCDYSTSVKCNFDKHSRSNKHQINMQNVENQKNGVSENTFISDVDKLKNEINQINAMIQDKQRLVTYEPILETLGSYEYKSIRKYIDNNGKSTYINPTTATITNSDKLCLDLENNNMVFSSNTNLANGFIKTDKYIDWLFFVHETKSVIIARQNSIIPDVSDLKIKAENLEKLKLIKEKTELDVVNESYLKEMELLNVPIFNETPKYTCAEVKYKYIYPREKYNECSFKYISYPDEVRDEFESYNSVAFEKYYQYAIVDMDDNITIIESELNFLTKEIKYVSYESKPYECRFVYQIYPERNSFTRSLYIANDESVMRISKAMYLENKYLNNKDNYTKEKTPIPTNHYASAKALEPIEAKINSHPEEHDYYVCEIEDCPKCVEEKSKIFGTKEVKPLPAVNSEELPPLPEETETNKEEIETTKYRFIKPEQYTISELNMNPEEVGIIEPITYYSINPTIQPEVELHRVTITQPEIKIYKSIEEEDFPPPPPPELLKDVDSEDDDLEFPPPPEELRTEISNEDEELQRILKNVELECSKLTEVKYDEEVEEYKVKTDEHISRTEINKSIDEEPYTKPKYKSMDEYLVEKPKCEEPSTSEDITKYVSVTKAIEPIEPNKPITKPKVKKSGDDLMEERQKNSMKMSIKLKLENFNAGGCKTLDDYKRVDKAINIMDKKIIEEMGRCKIITKKNIREMYDGINGKGSFDKIEIN